MVMQWFIRLVSGTANALEEIVRTIGDILSGENLVLMNMPCQLENMCAEFMQIIFNCQGTLWEIISQISIRFN